MLYLAVLFDLAHEVQRLRATKDWTLADKIRDELAAMSVVIEDRAGETTWRIESQVSLSREREKG